MIKLILVFTILLITFNLSFASKVEFTQEMLDSSPFLRYLQEYGNKFKTDEAVVKKGDNAFYKKKYNEAIEIYESYLNKYPDYFLPLIFRKLASSYDSIGRHDKADIIRLRAIDLSNKLIDKYKNDQFIGIVYNERQQFYLKINNLSNIDFQEAVSDYKKYIESEKAPGLRRCEYLSLGELYAKKGYWKESIEQFERVYNISISNKSEKDWDTYEASALIHMAEAYLQMGDKNKAFSSLKKISNKDFMIKFSKYKEIRKSFSEKELLEIEQKGKKH